MSQAVACSRCGQPLRPTDQFCTRCGAQHPGASGDPAAIAESTPSQGTAWDVVLDRLRADTLGVYDVAGELGHGGMAAVYLAHDIALDRKVAIKVMSPLLLTGPEMVKRFRQEAVTVARFDHPNIVSIYSVRQTGDLHYFVMKYVEGKELQTILSEQGALPLPIVQALLYEVASALDYAHRKGVIHRDIKPSNIMVDAEGKAIVTDFGIAKLAEGPSHTVTGTTLGTPLYMSPEQCQALPVNPATDQYSLGIVAYHMLTGEPPFTGSPLALLRAHVDSPPPAIKTPGGDCPQHVERAIHRMMAKKPEARFPAVRDAVRALGGEPVAHDDPIQDQIAAMVRLAGDIPATEYFTTPLSPPIPDSARVAPVREPMPESLAVSQAPGKITPGESLSLNAMLTRADGTTVSEPGVTWTSSDPTVATVDRHGRVLAHTPGNITISASAHGLEGSTEILVRVPTLPPRPEQGDIPVQGPGVLGEGDSADIGVEDASRRGSSGSEAPEPAAVGEPQRPDSSLREPERDLAEQKLDTRARKAGVTFRHWRVGKRRLLITAGVIGAIAGTVGGYISYGYLTVPPEPWENLKVAWSPDGSHLAFLAHGRSGANLYTVRAAGGGLREVASDAFGRVTWSPDGRWLSFAARIRTQDGEDGFQFGTQFQLTSPDGARVQRLVGEGPTGSLLAWSPDASRIAFWAPRDGVEHLQLADPSGANRRTLFSGPAAVGPILEDRPVVFSPDGAQVAFIAEGENDGAHALHVADVANGRVEYIAHRNGYRLIDPSWSADGEWLVFAATRTEPVKEGVIYRVRSIGTELTRLTDSTARVTSVQLSPDGRRIAFVDDAGQRRLYLMNADGSGLAQVVLPDSWVIEGSVSWSPDGGRVAFVTSAEHRRLFHRYRRNIALVNSDGSGLELVL